MPKPEGLDIYADDMKPKATVSDIIIRVHVPGCKHTAWAELHVERDDPHYINNLNWSWFGARNPLTYNSKNWHLLDIEKEVFNWLHEWELIELRPISPEDSEYFATDKLWRIIND